MHNCACHEISMKDAYLTIEKLVQGRIEGYKEQERIPLGTDSVLIARPSMGSDSVVPDIRVIGDDYISRTPVEISYEFGRDCYQISDGGTTNGTFLNGERLENNRAYRLEDNDLIGLAVVQWELRVILRFRQSDATLPGEVGQEEPWKPPSEEGLSVNLAARRVFENGREISLTKTEWKIFEVLHANQGMVCLLNEISMQVWGDEASTSELVVQHIRNIRVKVEPNPMTPRYIMTRPGGYLLDM